MYLFRYYDERDDEPLAYIERNRWWPFAEVAEIEDEYGFDESCPWFIWRDQSSIFLRDGSSRWVDVPEPYIAFNRFDNRDAYCGTAYYLLPASQRYGLRLARWQHARDILGPNERIAHDQMLVDTEPF